jgi:hypothetical protein
VSVCVCTLHSIHLHYSLYTLISFLSSLPHNDRFGFENFGLLWGLTIFVSSLTNFLQYPISLLVNALLHGSYVIPNAVLFLLTILSYLFPLFIWLRAKKYVSTGVDHVDEVGEVVI